jgi:hypothetical protein
MVTAQDGRNMDPWKTVEYSFILMLNHSPLDSLGRKEKNTSNLFEPYILCFFAYTLPNKKVLKIKIIFFYFKSNIHES